LHPRVPLRANDLQAQRPVGRPKAAADRAGLLVVIGVGAGQPFIAIGEHQEVLAVVGPGDDPFSRRNGRLLRDGGGSRRQRQDQCETKTTSRRADRFDRRGVNSTGPHGGPFRVKAKPFKAKPFKAKPHQSQLTLPVLMSCIAATIFNSLASTSALMTGLRLTRLAAVRLAFASATFCTSGSLCESRWPSALVSVASAGLKIFKSA